MTGANRETLHRLGAGAPHSPVCCPAAGAGSAERVFGRLPSSGGSSCEWRLWLEGGTEPSTSMLEATGEDEERTVRPTQVSWPTHPGILLRMAPTCPELPAPPTCRPSPLAPLSSQALAEPSSGPGPS